jgi:O-antigen/teichoic acid export membrane protein
MSELFLKINTNRNRNIIFNFLAQGINILVMFLCLPLLNSSFGIEKYGVFVLYHTFFLIVFQFNHIYTTFLKLLSSASGRIFLDTFFLVCIFLSTVLFVIFFLYKILIFGIVFILISGLTIFYLKSILVKKNLNSLSSFIIPFLNTFLVLGLLVINKFNLYIFLINLSYGFIIINILTTFIIGFKTFNLSSLRSRNKWNYLYKRTLQTSTFSMVTILQTNAEKFVIPLIFDMSTLGYYHLITFIPSRISSIYGNIALAFSKQIHEGNQDDFKIFTSNFFKYSSIISLFLVIFCCVFATTLLNHFIQEDINAGYYFVYFLSIIISLIQSLGFYSFQVYSRYNKLFRMTLVNLLSLFIYVCSIVLLSRFIEPFYALALALLISKFSEIYNVYYIDSITKGSALNKWIKTFAILIIIVFIYLTIWF